MMSISGNVELDTGWVVVCDVDRELLDSAAAYVEKEGLKSVELREGDVTNPDLPKGAFDLVHLSVSVLVKRNLE